MTLVCKHREFQLECFKLAKYPAGLSLAPRHINDGVL